MKLLRIFLFTWAAAAWAQYNYVPLLPDAPDTKVIAIYSDGIGLTAGELRAYAATQPADVQKQIAQDPAAFIKQFAVMRQMAAVAKAKKLDQQSPAKDMLYYSSTTFVGQLALQDAYTASEVDPEDIAKYYDTHKDDYKQVKVDAIYIAFGDSSTAPAGGKKVLTEAQAKEKAGKLLKQIRSGADFAKLARANSDDATSREKDGYLDTLTPGDNIPEGFRIVFKMKPGETSDPIWQPNGFYLLRAEAVDYRPLKDVRDKVFNQLKSQHVKDWLDKINSQSKVQFPDSAVQPKAKAPAPPPGGASK